MPRGSFSAFARVEKSVREGTSAAALADAVESFGQEDDISIIAVSRAAVAEPTAV